MRDIVFSHVPMFVFLRAEGNCQECPSRCTYCIHIDEISLPPANLVINWPEVEEDDISPEAKNIVTSLLYHDPTYRLGSSAVGGEAL